MQKINKPIEDFSIEPEKPRYNVIIGGGSVGITFKLSEAEAWFESSARPRCEKVIREMTSGQTVKRASIYG